jgi:hypothetical protein
MGRNVKIYYSRCPLEDSLLPLPERQIPAPGFTCRLRKNSERVTLTITKPFPAQRPGNIYLAEGGIETEIMYKWGFELPQFAMFPLDIFYLHPPKAAVLEREYAY